MFSLHHLSVTVFVLKHPAEHCPLNFILYFIVQSVFILQYFSSETCGLIFEFGLHPRLPIGTIKKCQKPNNNFYP